MVRATLQPLLDGASDAFATDDLPLTEEDAHSLRTTMTERQVASRSAAEQWDRIRSKSALVLPLIGAALGLLISLACVVLQWRLNLREEPWPAGIERLLPDPPDDLEPALASCLVEQREGPHDNAFVATVFDLVRRDAFTSVPAQGTARGVEVDIALGTKDRSGQAFTAFEQKVLGVIDEIVGDDHVPMGEFGDRLTDDLTMSTNVATYRSLFDHEMTSQVHRNRWLTRPFPGLMLALTALAVILLPVAVFLMVPPREFAFGIGSDPRILAAIGSSLLSFLGSSLVTIATVWSARLVMSRFTRGARERAARWTAYRDFLASYGDMQDEQTASIELWERHLVYAIAFGCADDILASVRPHAATPSQAGSVSSLASMSALSLHSFSSGIDARAPVPTSSGSGGFGGGGFSSSGGGGSFGGGGGGGAW